MVFKCCIACRVLTKRMSSCLQFTGILLLGYLLSLGITLGIFVLSGKSVLYTVTFGPYYIAAMGIEAGLFILSLIGTCILCGDPLFFRCPGLISWYHSICEEVDAEAKKYTPDTNA